MELIAHFNFVSLYYFVPNLKIIKNNYCSVTLIVKALLSLATDSIKFI